MAPGLLACGIAQTLTALSRRTRYSPISDNLPLSDATKTAWANLNNKPAEDFVKK